MSSRSRNSAARVACVAALALVATASRAADPAGAPAENSPRQVAVTTLFPGGGAMPAENPDGRKYEGDARAVADGGRLFDWYNCSGCHFHGAGGIGPSLADDTWIYGGRIDQIYDSIARGRPNGMPSWQGKIPPDQIWQIAAYIRSIAEAPEPVPATVPGIGK